jgi:hypothetical protein
MTHEAEIWPVLPDEIEDAARIAKSTDLYYPKVRLDRSAFAALIGTITAPHMLQIQPQPACRPPNSLYTR